MKKKSWLLLLIGLVIIIGIGGKIYMDNQKEKAEQQQEKNKLEAEKMSVVALKNMFADIKSVEIEKTGFNEMTGAYGMVAKMTNHKNESATFSYSFWKKRNEIGGYVLKDDKVQMVGKTLSKVIVVYSNGESEEI
ncbi:hypothetical protein [Carnobacterium maltaromaticum]|uniref:hypothetical protein n=1 Tax=Carnobacterium maltaromaticum TaxID=2751 RepID=UPI00191BAB43|nr:hypothetical protein [Carnobacterium maltaromaticum]CAD5901262.1 conserved hypothetical protein [Carnobacterium maltaromaticum]